MVGTILFNLIIAPLEMLFELVFTLAYRLFDSPLVILICLSIVVNLFALPLYKRADALQEEENERQAKMAHWVNHIKKTFKGDERYMMLTAYYRQQNYKSIQSLKGSLSLILQIPFFIAAYHYLSNLEILNEMSFWVFENLGQPDGLLQIGTLTINIMPIIMTLINVISAFIYLRGSTMSQKIQTYVLAAAFLVLLYGSPSGLVIYWTCNQLFSLFKNIFMKLVKSDVVLGICISAVGIAAGLLAVLIPNNNASGRLAFAIVVIVCCQLPLVSAIVKRRRKNKEPKPFRTIGFKTYIITAVFLTLFVGAAIPLTVISSSPSEFASYGYTPFLLVINNISIMAGIFIVWCGVFYYLGKPKTRTIFAYVFISLAVCAIIDFFIFGQGLGVMSSNLVYDEGLEFSTLTIILNFAVVAAVVVACCLFAARIEKFVHYGVIVLCVAALGFIITNSVKTANGLSEAGIEKKCAVEDIEPVFSLSKTGKNTIVLMLDRAISAYVPYMFEERPELEQQFDGFTYYPNTVTFGAHTNFAAPAVFGGYEYTPAKMNEREDELLADKHNEALKMLPTLFSGNGYEVTVLDPPYAGYSTTSDLSIYDGMENVTALKTIGKYECEGVEDLYSETLKIRKRNFVYYSLMKIMPAGFQSALYDKGDYYRQETNYYSSEEFLDNYAVLQNLSALTEITDENTDTLLLMDNETTHAGTVLNVPEYEPGVVDRDSIFDKDGEYIIGGMEMEMNSYNKVAHYEVNMAAFLKLGEWFDYLKEEGVYDNTRIIICSDHGYSWNQFDELIIKQDGQELDLQGFNALLLVKDYDAEGFGVSKEFMTVADVPSLACEGTIAEPVNPATGKEINSDEKTAHSQMITTSDHYRPNADHEPGYVFNTEDGNWWSVHDNIFDQANWRLEKVRTGEE